MITLLADTTYIAFGDESVNTGGVFYGLLLIPEDKVEIALDVVVQIKLKYGGGETAPLHCKELFHEDARNKSVWKHLSEEQAVEMCGDILRSLDALHPKYLLGHVPVSGYPKNFRLVGKNGHPDLVHEVNEKHLTLWAFFQVARLLDPVDIIKPSDPLKEPSPRNQPFWRVHLRRTQPGFRVRKVFLDRETTKISWFSKSFQFKTIAKDVVIENSAGVSHLPISLEGEDRHLLLDIADIFTYSVSRSMSSGRPLEYRDFTGEVELQPITFGDEIVLGGGNNIS